MAGFLEFGLTPMVYVGVFLGMLVAFEGVRQLVSRSESASETRNRRMRMIAKGASKQDVLNLLNPSDTGWQYGRVPIIGKLPVKLLQAGITMKPSTFMVIIFTVTIVVGILATAVVIPVIAAAFAVLVCMAVPIGLVHAISVRRMSALEHQLPEALDLMARGLIVGHPLNTTIAAVANEMADPIASNFGTMMDQISYGDDLVDAFMDFSERTELEDVRYLAISVAIQNGTGGDLGSVLQTLAKVIRGRISLRKRIQAISSEGRLTSIFLSLLPVFIFVTTSLTSPDYYGGVSDDPLFRPFAVFVVFFVVANFLVLRRLVDFRI